VRRFAAVAVPAAVVLLASLAGPASAAEIPAAVDATRIPVYKVIAPGLAVGGQPTATGLAALKELGFRTVVSLRPEPEGPADEPAVVEGQGLRFVRVPVTPDSFGPADVDVVQKILEDPAAAPVLLHCASSNRVGAVWAVIQARRGLSAEDAEAKGREAGLHSPAMQEALRRVLALKP
jgi:uncharacterized protein (TIGR01244 family)